LAAYYIVTCVNSNTPLFLQSAATGFHVKYPDLTSEEYAFTNAEVNREVMLAEQGHAAMKATTLVEVFQEAVKLYADKPILKVEEVDPNPPGKPKPGEEAQKPPPSAELSEWKTWTYQSYYDDSKKAAAAFIQLGFQKHDAVSVYGFNSPQWHLSAMGGILAGGVIAGIYPSDTAQQVQFKVCHSGAVVAVVQDEKKLKMFLDMRRRSPSSKGMPTSPGSYALPAS